MRLVTALDDTARSAKPGNLKKTLTYSYTLSTLRTTLVEPWLVIDRAYADRPDYQQSTEG